MEYGQFQTDIADIPCIFHSFCGVVGELDGVIYQRLLEVLKPKFLILNLFYDFSLAMAR